jgi:hypothetical protein
MTLDQFGQGGSCCVKFYLCVWKVLCCSTYICVEWAGSNKKVVVLCDGCSSIDFESTAELPSDCVGAKSNCRSRTPCAVPICGCDSCITGCCWGNRASILPLRCTESSPHSPRQQATCTSGSGSTSGKIGPCRELG